MKQTNSNIPGYDADGNPCMRQIVTTGHAAAFLLKLAAARTRPA